MPTQGGASVELLNAVNICFFIISPVFRINTLLNIMMETRIRPITNFIYPPMLYRIPMDIIDMTVVIVLIFD
ncbi:hypothetical protein BJL95_13335 [Methylomonas sp. LWB]|nr:hypothetical protein BJL95_13335 [Methylomonas sp. LWB]